MKNLLNTVYKVLVLGGVLLGGAACDDDVHDFSKTTPADEAVSIYIADSVFTYSVDWSLDMEPTASMDTVIVRFPVHLTEPVEHDVEVMLMVDDQLRINYNTAHGVDYKTVAPEYVELINQTLLIRAGETQSDSVVTVVCKRPVSWFVDTTGFMIPVRMRYYKGGGVKPNYEERHSRIVVNTSRVNGVYFETENRDLFYVVGEGVNTGSEFVTVNDVRFNLEALWISNANVTLTVDNSLIAAYNTANGTNLQPIPTDDLQQSYIVPLAGGAPAGNVYRKSFALNYTGDQLDDERGYLIPLVITNVDGERIENVPAQSVFYVRIDVSLWFLQLVQTPPGAVLPPAGFTSSAKNANTGASTTWNNAMIFNGNKTDLFAAPNFPLDVFIDLGTEVADITGVGIYMMPGNISYGYRLTYVEVGFATEEMYGDGEQTAMGAVSTSEVTATSFIQFNNPVTARYIYLNRMTGASGLIPSEIEIYK